MTQARCWLIGCNFKGNPLAWGGHVRVCGRYECEVLRVEVCHKYVGRDGMEEC